MFIRTTHYNLQLVSPLTCIFLPNAVSWLFENIKFAIIVNYPLSLSCSFPNRFHVKFYHLIWFNSLWYFQSCLPTPSQLVSKNQYLSFSLLLSFALSLFLNSISRYILEVWVSFWYSMRHMSCWDVAFTSHVLTANLQTRQTANNVLSATNRHSSPHIIIHSHFFHFVSTPSQLSKLGLSLFDIKF